MKSLSKLFFIFYQLFLVKLKETLIWISTYNNNMPSSLISKDNTSMKSSEENEKCTSKVESRLNSPSEVSMTFISLI